MSPFEVPEGPYTIEKIMDSIRTQVVEPPKAAPAGPDGEAGAGASVEAPRPIIHDGSPVSRLTAQLELLRQRQSLDPGYRIKSHRPVIGPIFDFIKRVIHWGSRPYTDAVRLRQEDFNETLLHALREVSLQFEANIRRLDEYEARFNAGFAQHQANLEQHGDRLNRCETRLNEHEPRIFEHHAFVNAQQEAIHELQQFAMGEIERIGGLEERVARRDAELTEQTATLTTQLDELRGRYDMQPLTELSTPERRLEAMDHTRGDYEDIRCRQFSYMELFEGAPGQVLDIGCGRGELLKHLNTHGIECWGADIDPVMVETCLKQGIHAVQQDALSALRSVAPGSLGGIFAAQVIEHFFPGEVVRFIAEARRRMAPGARLVIETLNPASLAVHAKSYYRDLEHKQMIHPEHLRGMLELAGFTDVELRYRAPFGEDERLPELPAAAELGLPESARQALQTRLDRLNGLLYGMQDYVIIARQGEPAALQQEVPSE